MKATAVSPAKVILFGEHFVVGGNSAISMTINLATTVTVEPLSDAQIEIRSEDLNLEAVFSQSQNPPFIRGVGVNVEDILEPIYETAAFTLNKLKQPGRGLRIKIESKVPIGMGLGSSAATAVGTVSAIARLLGRELRKEEIFEAAYTLERLMHGNPSGIDQATVTFGGLISYRLGKVEGNLQVARAPMLVIGNTGRRRSTGEFVGRVTRLRETKPDEYGKIASKAQKVSDRATEALEKGDYEVLGTLMNENQRLLELVGVSSPDLERLISRAKSAGAFGAKLTGGGGGGCMIAAVDESSRDHVERSIQEAGGQVVQSEFVSDGVRTTVS